MNNHIPHDITRLTAAGSVYSISHPSRRSHRLIVIIGFMFAVILGVIVIWGL